MDDQPKGVVLFRFAIVILILLPICVAIGLAGATPSALILEIARRIDLRDIDIC